MINDRTLVTNPELIEYNQHFMLVVIIKSLLSFSIIEKMLNTWPILIFCMFHQILSVRTEKSSSQSRKSIYRKLDRISIIVSNVSLWPHMRPWQFLTKTITHFLTHFQIYNDVLGHIWSQFWNLCLEIAIKVASNTANSPKIEYFRVFKKVKSQSPTYRVPNTTF